MMPVNNTISWKLVLIPALVMVLLAIYPQLSLWISKGASWQGSYVVANYDEAAYSAYINAIANGKPRRNDPFVGVDDAGFESLYSIQFVPAYLVAFPARLLGMSTSSAFILLDILTAVLAFLALFWFIFSVMRDRTLAVAGTLVTLCLGTVVAFQGQLCRWLGGMVVIDFFPFLRRYQPGVAFPLFFVFCGLVWRSYTNSQFRKSLSLGIAAGFLFALLVFSYFYFWTAAAAWVVCITVVSFIWLREKRRHILANALVVGAFAVASLIPYSAMLANRSPNLDSVQLLSITHVPDIMWPSLILGLLILFLIGILVYRGRLTRDQPQVLLAGSLALTPLILFNQQIVTGRSLQPIHYEIFISNYLVLTSLILLVGPLIPAIDAERGARARKMLNYIAAAALLWGFVEAVGSTSYNATAAEIRDESVSAIREIERTDVARPQRGPRPVVLATNFITSDIVPTFSTFRPLWSAHTSSAGGVTATENKRLFYLFLYYSGYSERDLVEAISSNSFEATSAIFGSERALPALGKGKAIGMDDIQKEAQNYSAFVRNFSLSHASNPTLNYLIVPAKAEPNYSNLDRWYQRDEGKTFGLFKVYALTPKFSVQPDEMSAAPH